MGDSDVGQEHLPSEHRNDDAEQQAATSRDARATHQLPKEPAERQHEASSDDDQSHEDEGEAPAEPGELD